MSLISNKFRTYLQTTSVQIIQVNELCGMLKSQYLKKYAFNRVNIQELAVEQSLPTLRLSDASVQDSSRLCLDPFFYRDPVTLKKYSVENLKETSDSKRVKTEGQDDEIWRKTQEIKMMNVMDYIGILNQIKTNRRNVLVYGTEKREQSSRFPRQGLSDETMHHQKKERLQEITEPQRPEKIPQNSEEKKKFSRIKSIEKKSARYSYDMQKLNQTAKIGKLKRKMNDRIYSMNKELLREYLDQKKQYDPSFNCLTTDKESLNIKFNKFQKLAKMLNKEGKENQIDLKIECHNELPKKIKKSTVAKQSNSEKTAFQESRLKLNSDRKTPTKRHTARIKTQNSTLKSREIIQNSNLPSKLTVKNKIKANIKNFIPWSVNNLQSEKFNKYLDEQWTKMDHEITKKYRRDAQYALNKNSNPKSYMSKKKKKIAQLSKIE